MYTVNKIDDILSYSHDFFYIDKASKDIFVLNSNHNFDKRFYEWVNIIRHTSSNDKSRSLLDAFKKMFYQPVVIIACPTSEEYKTLLAKLLTGEYNVETLCS